MQLENVLQVREATRDDITALQFLSQVDGQPGLSPLALRRYIETGRVLVGEIDKCIVGCIIYRFCRNARALVNRLYIAPIYNRMGVEQHLIRVLKNKSIVRGKKYLLAKARVSDASNEYYQRCGFLEQRDASGETYRFWCLAWVGDWC